MCKQGAYGTGAPGALLKNIKWIVWNSRRLLKKEQKKKKERKTKQSQRALSPLFKSSQMKRHKHGIFVCFEFKIRVSQFA